MQSKSSALPLTSGATYVPYTLHCIYIEKRGLKYRRKAEWTDEGVLPLGNRVTYSSGTSATYL